MQKIIVPLIILLVLGGLLFLFAPAPKPGMKDPRPSGGTVASDSRPVQTPSADLPTSLKRANEALDRNRFDDVLGLLESYRDQDSVELHGLLGYAYAGRKEFPEAVAAFEKAWGKGRDSKILYALAVTLETMGEPKKAKERFQALAGMQLPTAISARVQLAIARLSLLLNDDIPTALEAYKKALRDDPTQVDSFVGLLKLMKRTGNSKGVDKLRERGDPLHGNQFEYQFWLGSLYYEQGLDEPALAAFRACVKLNPGNATPHYFIYRILRKSKKIEDAVAELERFYQWSSFLPYIFFQAAIDAKLENRLPLSFKFLRASVLFDRVLLGRDDQGTINAVSRYISTKGSSEEKLFMSAFDLFLNGDYRGAFTKGQEVLGKLKDKALKTDLDRLLRQCGEMVSGEDSYNAYQVAMKSEQESALGRLKAGLAARKAVQGNAGQQALDELKTKALSNPKDAKLQYSTALQLARAGDVEGSKVFLRETVRANPLVSEAYYSLAKIARFEGNVQEVVSHLEQAIKINPGNSQARSLLAGAYLDNGDFDRATEEAKSALLANPNNGEARMVLAQVKLQGQQREQALREVEYGLQVETDPARREQFEALHRQLSGQ